jgi:Tfp pilus assembly protein PilN
MFNLDSALGASIDGGRLSMASVKKGIQDYALKNHLSIERFRDIPQTELYHRVQRFVKANGFNRENVILGLPREEVVIREVEFPLDVEENLEEVLRMQVDKFEPSEAETSYYDYSIIERDELGKRIIVQIAMVRKALLDDYLALFEEMDLYPAAIRVGSVGLQNLLQVHSDGFPKKEGVLLLKINHAGAEILVVTPERRLYSEYTRLPEGNVSADRLLEEVNSFVHHADIRIEGFSKLYLAGELAGDLLQAFRERVPETELLRKRLRLGDKAVGNRDSWEQIATAVGLAVSGIVRAKTDRMNLIPPEKRVVGERPSLVPTYFLCFLMILVLGGWGTLGFFQQRVLLDQIDVQIQSLEKGVNEAFELRDYVVDQRAELEELQEMMGDRQRTLSVLADLTERIPDDTFLQNLQIRGDELTMQGYSDQASTLVPILLESPYLESVKTNWITQDRKMQGKERFNFTATVGTGGSE